jgi:hypothetical protein
MSRAQLSGALAVALTLFLFEAGPIWRHPWDMELLNRAIFWSYVAIPLLVIGCLAWSRHLSWKAFLVDTLVLTLVKYTCTFAFALVLWEVTPFPARAPTAALPHAAHLAAAESRLAVTPIDPAKTGAVTAAVLDASGHPLPGALVWISSGLEDYVFAPPTTPATIDRADVVTPPSITVVQVNQPVLARSTDGKLHTLIAMKDGKTLFNTPLLPSGDPSHPTFGEARGLVTLKCNIHPAPAEAEGQILVVAHPFFGWTDERGHVAFHGVPAGRIKLAATSDEGAALEQAVDVATGSDVTVKLTFGAVLAATLPGAR